MISDTRAWFGRALTLEVGFTGWSFKDLVGSGQRAKHSQNRGGRNTLLGVMTAARAILWDFKKSPEKSLALKHRCFSCHNSLRMLEWEEIYFLSVLCGSLHESLSCVFRGHFKIRCCVLLPQGPFPWLKNKASVKQCAIPPPIFPTTQGCWLGRADWCGGATSETLVEAQGCSANRSSFYIQCLKRIIKTLKVSLLSINFMYKNRLSFFIVFQRSSSLTLRFSSTIFFGLFYK